ncbi:FadR/GntR family transcriptional regulator [Phytoactinopolyspora halotolerans]|uniref:FadR family transcriptional regulator n=1 Tax=Phytoactinopolyspora halotolerans TaxID=1981512 RepID=A0A6L9S849_9ACTN|nr:FadR/GntR family transcriptional regulator [Phytoactinopolyspora halotolerans]NEE00871.1 FadR family transcriptional regulator [Phytoactinopolyspora halotolerans]
MVSPTLHSAVLDALGSDIVSGDLPAGSVLTLESLQERYSVSRGVARECMRILESLHLVRSQRRTGIRIEPESAWNVYDRRVIRWRLDSKHRGAQLRSLTELRLGIEPIAAHLASLRATDEERAELRAATGDMRRFGDTHRPGRYLSADVEFHRIILTASRNEMYVALFEPIAEVLQESPSHGRPEYPVPETIGYHEAVMEAVCAGDPDGAEKAMTTLLSDVRAALKLV